MLCILCRGSPAYVAPEMARRYFKEYMSSASPITPKADIYAFGISMLELWQGYLPWRDLPTPPARLDPILENGCPESDGPRQWPRAMAL